MYTNLQATQKPLVEHRTPEQRRQLAGSIAFHISLNASTLVVPSLEYCYRLLYGQDLEEIGAYGLAGTIDLSKPLADIWINDVEWWSFKKIKKDMVIDVPPSVYERCMKAKTKRLPFKELILAEQHVLPKIETEYITVERIHYYSADPILLATFQPNEREAILVVMGAWMEQHG